VAPALRFRLPEVFLLDNLRLWIDPNPPDPPFRIDLPYRKNWGLTWVHLRQGEREQLLLADAEGRVELPLADFQAGAATLTVTRPGYRPVVQQVELGRSRARKPFFQRGLAAILEFLRGSSRSRALDS